MSEDGARTGYHEAPVVELERVFARIGRERMTGLPLLNEALRVEAVGLRRTDMGWAGILVTPWLMNLMLLPAHEVPWQPLSIGQRRRIRLPAGIFELLGGWEPELGSYQYGPMCSTMSAFADHDAARQVAAEIAGRLFDASTADAVARMNPSGLEWTAAPQPADPATARRNFLLGCRST